MEDIFTYYHLFVALLFGFWILIFLSRSELRREMLLLGILAVFLIPLVFTINQIDVSEVRIRFTAITFADLLFAFSLSGIAGTAFHAIFGKHYHKLPSSGKKKVSKDDSIAQIWFMQFFIAFLLLIWGVVLMNLFFNIPVLTGFFLSAVIISVYMISNRHDLLSDAIWSAFLTGFIAFLSSTLASIFTNTDFTISPITSSATFLGVPADLLLWSIAAGLVLGPLYEFIRTLELK